MVVDGRGGCSATEGGRRRSLQVRAWRRVYSKSSELVSIVGDFQVRQLSKWLLRVDPRGLDAAVPWRRSASFRWGCEGFRSDRARYHPGRGALLV